jgi:Rrf2 family protein
MKFSTKGEYGLRLAVNLGKNYPQRKSVGDISAEENISLKYLERLIGELRKNNLVESLKGKNGGYILTKDPKEIPVGEVIEIMEGPLTSKCANTNCGHIKNCPSSLVWIKLEQAIKKTLYDIKLSDLIK